MNNNEVIDHPNYYRLPCGRDLEDYIAWRGLFFEPGSALKYYWRAGKKFGESREKDIAKYNHYCRLVSDRTGETIENVRRSVVRLADDAAKWDGVETLLVTQP